MDKEQQEQPEQPEQPQEGQQERQQPGQTPPPPRLCVVGIGASAGGLEALKEFFSAMPSDNGMAFVVIVHLDPTHASHLPELLANYTEMPVRVAEEGAPVEANTVYVIPPNAYLSFREGKLQLTEPAPRDKVPMPIDYLFRSLAEELAELSVCIVLSGTGSDGTAGLRAVRAAGGLTMVQTPSEAQYDGMPRSALQTGLVDYVLPVRQMPETLLTYLQQDYLAREREVRLPQGSTSDLITAILRLVLVQTGSDFQYYKKGTVLRRIDRRMSIQQISSLQDYLRFVRENSQEATELARDMLISVTSFFRESEAWEELRQMAIIPLVNAHVTDDPIRIWVPGCATGEEAYSVAILLREVLSSLSKQITVQIFATDIDEDALGIARNGVYPASASNDIPDTYLERYFTKQDGTFQINKQLREMVVFSVQNLVSDPPFSKLDLVCCRNVLIYLETEIQKKIIGLFGFALHQDGYLFLGKSERVVGQMHLFELISERWRIYRRTSAAPSLVDLPIPPAARHLVEAPSIPRGRWNITNLADIHQQSLQRYLNAASILVDYRGNILHFFGPTDLYLYHPTGEADLNLLRMARPELDLKLRVILREAADKKEVQRYKGAQLVLKDGQAESVDIVVIPATDPRTGEGLFSIVFEAGEKRAIKVAVEGEQGEDRGSGPRTQQLERELQAVKSDLQGTIEELVNSNEELKAANEEMMSMNEELQSSNEELQSSKEELQSVNEELTTLNSQLAEKVDELSSANNDLANLISSTGMATVFLGRDLRIKRYTPQASKLLNLIPADVGRPIGHITAQFDGDLVQDANKVLANLNAIEKEVRTFDGSWYILRILPYRTLEDKIEGVVVTFSEVTHLKQMQGELERSHRYAHYIVETMREPLLVLDSNLRVVEANSAFRRTFQVAERETEGQLLYELGSGQWDIPELRSQLEQVIPRGAVLENFEVQHEFPHIGRRAMLVNARRMSVGEKKESLILLTIEDITNNKSANEEILRDIESWKAEVVKAKSLADERTAQLRALGLGVAWIEERECRDLAGAIRDRVRQSLAEAQNKLAAARRQIENAEQAQLLGQVDSLLAQSIEGADSLCAERVAPARAEGKLVEALEWLVAQAQRRDGLTVDLDADSAAEPQTQELREFIFRAIRELLANVAKHAGVNQARVYMRRFDDKVRIEVSDRGKGCDPEQLAQAAPSAEHLGLFSIRERASALGGSVQIEGSPKRGCRVTLVLPMRVEQ